MPKIKREMVLSYFLGFVVLYFAWNEIFHTDSWVALVPDFLTKIVSANKLVIAHGVLLAISGLALIFNFYRRFAAFVLAIMLIQIIYSLTGSLSSLNDVAVRDIGLLGIAIALVIKN